jgi:hypothetical protein
VSSEKELRGAHYYAKFLTLLIEGGTYLELQEAGLSYHTVIRYCKALREFGRAYIDHWEFDDRGAPTRPFWKFCLTKKRDAVKPVRSKEYLAQYARDWRAAKRKRLSTSVFNQKLPRYAPGTRDSSTRTSA